MLESKFYMPALASPQLWGWIAIALAAGFLAYIFDPIVERLTRRRVPRALAVIFVLMLALATMVGLLLVVLPVFYKESRLFMEKLPGFVAWFNEHAAPWLKAKLDFNLQLDVDSAKQLAREMLAENENLSRQLLGSLKLGGMVVIALVANLVLVPVVLFYLLRDWNVLLSRIDELIPPRIHAKVRVIAGEIDAVLAEWLRGQLLVIVLMSCYYVIAL